MHGGLHNVMNVHMHVDWNRTLGLLQFVLLYQGVAVACGET